MRIKFYILKSIYVFIYQYAKLKNIHKIGLKQFLKMSNHQYQFKNKKLLFSAMAISYSHCKIIIITSLRFNNIDIVEHTVKINTIKTLPNSAALYFAI